MYCQSTSPHCASRMPPGAPTETSACPTGPLTFGSRRPQPYVDAPVTCSTRPTHPAPTLGTEPDRLIVCHEITPVSLAERYRTAPVGASSRCSAVLLPPGSSMTACARPIAVISRPVPPFVTSRYPGCPPSG